MDFFISLIYLLLGVFPLSILSGLKDTLPSQLGLTVSGLSQYMWDLEPSQKYAFVLGWVMWLVIHYPTLIILLLTDIGAFTQHQVSSIAP